MEDDMMIKTFALIATSLNL